MLGLDFTPPRSFETQNHANCSHQESARRARRPVLHRQINEAAKRAGLSVKFVKSQRDALDQAAEGAVLIILDLNFTAIQPVELIQKFKADPNLQRINLVGYVSHVQGELKQEAQEAGCDMVMARSAFSQSLQQIMKRHAD